MSGLQSRSSILYNKNEMKDFNTMNAVWVCNLNPMIAEQLTVLPLHFVLRLC